MTWSSGDKNDARRSVSARTPRKASHHVRRKACEAESVSGAEGLRIFSSAVEAAATDGIIHSKYRLSEYNRLSTLDGPWQPLSQGSRYRELMRHWPYIGVSKSKQTPRTTR